MKRQSLTPVLLTALLSVAATTVWTGCRSASWSQDKETGYTQQTPSASRTEVPRYEHSAPAPAPAEKPLARPAAPEASNEFTLRSDLLQVHKRVPAKAALGQNIEAVLTITALDNCAEVVVTDQIPTGATYVKSEPAASVDGRTLTWKIATLDKGQVVTGRVWYRADEEGTLVNCATMVAIPRGCAGTFVGRPAIAIEKTGPAKARLGQDLTYTVVVKNTGTAAAENVVVTDAIPDGLTHASGQKSLTMNVGTLAPNESKTFTVPLKAAQRGQFCNVASVATSNAGSAKDDACTVVTEPKLTLAKTGTKEQFIGKTADYEITVANPGDESLTNVTITDSAPAATRIVAAPGATVTGNSATWKLAELKGGAKESLRLTLTSATAGTHCNRAGAVSAEGLSANAEACTLWRGQAAILIEVIDNPDPILIGENTTFTVRVTNQGTADDTNIKLVAKFGNEVNPVSGAGSTAVTVDGRTVNFGIVSTLPPKQAVQWTVTAKGAAAGDHRLKVDLTSDLLRNAVTEEESTHVY